MDYSTEYITSFSKDNNEPSWLLEERLNAFKILQKFNKQKEVKELLDNIQKRSKASGRTRTYDDAIDIDPFNDADQEEVMLLTSPNDLNAAREYWKDQKIIKELFLNRINKPKDFYSSFINAFFDRVNIVYPIGKLTDNHREISIRETDKLAIDFIVPRGNLKILQASLGNNYYIEEIIIPENAKVEKIFLCEGDYSVSYQSAVLNENSKFSFTSSLLSPLWLETKSILNGDRSDSDNLNIFFLEKEEALYLNSVLDHYGIGTRGNILVKGILKDRARAKLDGMIKIEKNAAESDSFLEEYAMLLNPGAHAEANPELEIENNNVRCTHSASVGEIDEEKLFYLMSRGMNREEAKRAMVEGFLNPVLERIPIEELRQEIKNRIESKYQ